MRLIKITGLKLVILASTSFSILGANAPGLCGTDSFKDAAGQDYRQSKPAQLLQKKKKLASQICAAPDKEAAWPIVQQETMGLNTEALQEILSRWDSCDWSTIQTWLEDVALHTKIKVPVLYAEYPDTPAGYTVADIEDNIFGGACSTTLQDYYKEVSYGHLSVTGDVYGVFEVGTDYEDYSKDSSGAKQFIRDVVEAADPYVDFSQYDSDGDGYVDAVIIVASEYIDASGSSSAHRSTISPYTTDDGVIVSDYTSQKETACARLYCHEFGHILGLPDQYYDGSGSIGIGKWCLMANGTGHLCPWCKIELGFATPKIITGAVYDQEIRNVETYPDIFQLAPGNLPSEEYFLVENRQLADLDVDLPGSGLLIWHVGSDHEPVLLEEADGLDEIYTHADTGDAGDPFPGSSTNRTFTSSTYPSSDFSDGAESGITVENISDSSDTMTADFYVPSSVSGWRSLDSGVTEDLKDVSFANNQEGWVVGEGGLILHTTDGGKTWNQQESGTTNHLYKIQAISENEAWVCGYKLMLHTTDGSTWATSSNICEDFYFVNQKTGWFLYNSNLVKTTDGGASWITNNISSTKTDEGYPENVRFTDESTGYLIGNEYLFKSTDGGTTWTSVFYAVDPYAECEFYADSEKLWAINSEARDFLYYSGGVGTRVDDTDADGFHDIDFSGNVGVIVGDGIAMYDATETLCPGSFSRWITNCTEGGWTEVIATDDRLRGVDLTSESVGYAVGDDGVILKYQPDYYGEEWALNISGEDSAGERVAVDENDNVFMTGYFESTVSVDTLCDGTNQITSSGLKDAIISSYTSDGKLNWAISFGGSGNDYGRSIVVDDNYVYVAGAFSETIASGNYTLTSRGNLDIFVLKIEKESGGIIWAKTMGGIGIDGGRGVDVDEDGNVYVCGQFAYTVDFNPGSGTYHLTASGMSDAFICKLDSNGDFNWASRIGGSAADVAHDLNYADDSLWVGGYFQNTAYFGGKIGLTKTGSLTTNDIYKTSNGKKDIFVAQYLSRTNRLQWVKTCGAEEDDIAYGLDIDEDYDVYAVGSFCGTVDFDPGSAVSNLNAGSTTANSAFLWALTESGNYRWARSHYQMPSAFYDSSIAYDVVANQCDVYVTGEVQGFVDFDSSSALDMSMEVCTCSWDMECADVFIWNVSKDGENQWKEVADDDTTGRDAGKGLSLSSQGDLFVTGYFQDETITLDGNELTSESGSGYQDIFLWKYKPE